MKHILLVVAAVMISSPAASQDFAMKGRSSVELHLGLWTGWTNAASVSILGVRTETKSSGPSGMVLYSRWLEENLSVIFGVSGLSVDNSTTTGVLGTEVRSSSVGRVLMGVRFYLPYPATDAGMRPFLTTSVGPYLGHEEKSSVLTVESHSETAFGGYLGAGVDFLLGNRIKLGLVSGYHLMTDFSVPVGAKKNYSGADFMMGVGYLFDI